MKTKLLSILFVALISCVPGQVVWPKLVQCASPAIDDVVGNVTRVLLEDGTDSTIGDRATNELEQLAADHGPALIACVINQLVTDWTAPGAAAEPTRLAAATRGQTFLAHKDVQIQ